MQERTSETPFTEDPLQNCQIDGLPSSKEEGERQLEELVLYEKTTDETRIEILGVELE